MGQQKEIPRNLDPWVIALVVTLLLSNMFVLGGWRFFLGVGFFRDTLGNTALSLFFMFFGLLSVFGVCLGIYSLCRIMRIISYTFTHIGSLTNAEAFLEDIICGVIARSCILHAEYEGHETKERSLAELAPAKHILPRISGGMHEKPAITFTFAFDSYDIEKMRLIKQRMQMIKHLFTTYTRIPYNRTACVQSPLADTNSAYTLVCTYDQRASLRKVQGIERLSVIEQFYVTYYHLLQSLCEWREHMMHVSVVGKRKPFVVFSASIQKIGAMHL